MMKTVVNKDILFHSYLIFRFGKFPPFLYLLADKFKRPDFPYRPIVAAGKELSHSERSVL